MFYDFSLTLQQMRKWVSIMFLFVYLTAFTSFREVLKLPVLVEHFIEHRAANPSISFLAFLDMHYVHGSPRDADYDRDMQLPFKMVSHTFLTLLAIPSSAFTFHTARALYCKKEKPLLLDPAAYSFNYQNTIWQPPKTC